MQPVVVRVFGSQLRLDLGVIDDAARRASVQDPEFAASGSTTQEQVTNTIKDQLQAITPNATIWLRVGAAAHTTRSSNG